MAEKPKKNIVDPGTPSGAKALAAALASLKGTTAGSTHSDGLGDEDMWVFKSGLFPKDSERGE